MTEQIVAGDVTLGEVARNLVEIKAAMEKSDRSHSDAISSIATKIDSLSFVRPDVYNANREADAKDVKTLMARVVVLETNRTWTLRAIYAAIIGIAGDIGARVFYHPHP